MGSEGKDRDYGDCEEIVDAVMDMIAKRWTKSMIKRELREYFPGLSATSCQWIITQAKRKICKIYNIDPQEYKGKQIAFYELVLRSKEKIKDKLAAAERLDKLLGLEHISIEDPLLMAEKIIAFKKQAEKTVGGQTNNGGTDRIRETESERSDGGKRSKDVGSRQDDSSRNESNDDAGASSQEKKEEKPIDNVDSEITPEDPEIKANIDDVLKNQKDPKKTKEDV